MLKKFIGENKITFSFTIVLMIATTVILSSDLIWYKLLLVNGAIVVVFVVYCFLTTYLLSRSVKKGTKELVEKFPDEMNEYALEYEKNGFKWSVFRVIAPLFQKLESIIAEKKQTEMDMNRLNLSLEENLRMQKFILEVNNSIFNYENPMDFINFILENAVDFIPNATHGSVIKNIDGKSIEFIAAYGYKLSDLQKMQLTLEETYIYKMSDGEIAEPKICRDLRAFNSEHIQKEKFNAFTELKVDDVNTSMCSPIFVENELYGLLNIDSSINKGFEEDVIPIMKYLASQIGMAINNYLIHSETLHMSKYDSLTGAYSRNYFEEIVHLTVNRALRYQDEFVITVVDMNNLKKINDQYGHLVGDKAIRAMATSFKNDIRDSDIFARFGGDEFVMVFHNCDREEITNKMEFLLLEIQKNPVEVNNEKIILSFAHGSAFFPSDGKTIEELIKVADERMYKNKLEFKRKMND
ncbi:MAG: sensor domain-containing diguanylate cyclase [Clostridiales bacterium]|nr:sensor domain-containing diguanylate cyclase [Clostridiales bacterium]